MVSERVNGNDDAGKNLYEVLDLHVPTTRVRQDALTEKDIKGAYRRALLRWHPDKLAGKGKKSTPADAVPGSDSSKNGSPAWTVDQITRAYEVLSDPKSRQQYDESLLRGADSSNGHKSARHITTELDIVDLDDMDLNEQRGSWSKSCRCGNVRGFTISEDEMEEAIRELNGSQAEVLLACEDCSHHIKVLFTVGEDDG